MSLGQGLWVSHCELVVEDSLRGWEGCVFMRACMCMCMCAVEVKILWLSVSSDKGFTLKLLWLTIKWFSSAGSTFRNSSKIKERSVLWWSLLTAPSLMPLFHKGLDKKRLDGEREGGSLLLQEVPLYPGAHTHVPSSGEQDPPFWQEQLTEQLGPQKPCGHTLSQWIPADTLQWQIFSECTLRRQRLACWNILNSLPSVKIHHQRTAFTMPDHSGSVAGYATSMDPQLILVLNEEAAVWL